MNKSLLLIASSALLTACGGGSGGGPLPDVGNNTYFSDFSSQVSSLEAKIANASVSALVNPSQDDKKTAQEVVQLIKDVDAYWTRYKAGLSDAQYARKSQQEDFQEAEAIIQLLKTDYLTIAQKVAEGETFDTEEVKKYADATQVENTIKTTKQQLFSDTITNISTVSNVEVSRVVGENSNERKVAVSTTKGTETVSGGTKTNVKRLKNYEQTTLYVTKFDRTTTVILEDQRVITFADGTTRIEVLATKTQSNTVTLDGEQTTEVRNISDEIPYVVKVDKPIVETITEDPVIETDRSDTSTREYTDDAGNLVKETTVRPVKTTTVKTKRIEKNLHRTVYTYDDGHVLEIDEPDTISESYLADQVTKENLPEEVLKDITVQLVKETTTQKTTVDKVESDPVFSTTHEDKTEVVEADGKRTTTVTRYYTTTVTITTTTTTTVNKQTVKKYSDGRVETIDHEPEVTVTTDDDIGTDKFTKVISQTVEDIAPVGDKTVVDEDVSYGGKIYSHLEETFGEPVTTTEDVITYDGDWKITTRVTTVSTPRFHEHFDTQVKTTIITYSDGSKETVEEEILVSRGKVEKPATVVVTEEELNRVNTDPNGGVIGNDHPDMGTRTPGYNSDPSTYRDSEFSYISNRQLNASNFDVAYSRGWTGKGSLIAIADTGIDASHSDLNDNIAYNIDHINYGTDSSHGTHVAGIAAAEKNGTGMHGAAFDAKIASIKIGYGNYVSYSLVDDGLASANSLGAVAFNLSAELKDGTRSYTNTITKLSDGVYTSSHSTYSTKGYSEILDDAQDFKAALGNEMVWVQAAGNTGNDYTIGYPQLATATDANGNLILDGQMLVVGNYDTGNDSIKYTMSAKAGHVCVNFNGTECLDKFQTKDFFIMADGMGVTSTKQGGGYVTMSGTSMAAPVVTGSIAVLHQMWPFMKGKHLVQLVLVTGNKNIPNYDENVHGQGLLDMDRATRPVGATGIPTSGRTDGGTSAISGGVSTSAGQITALTGVMVLDSFERDFYIDLGQMTQSVDTRTASVAEQMGAVNYFAGHMNGNQHVTVPYNISENSSLQLGYGRADNSYLGNSFSGTLGTSTASNTFYGNYNYRNGGFYAQLGLGVTHVEMNKSNSMLDSSAPVISSTATMGYEFAPAEGQTLGFAVSQPVTVESAKMKYNVPVGRTLDGAVQHEMRTVDFKSAEREVDLGTYYKFNVGSAEVSTFAEVRTGVAALKKELDKRIGISLQYKF